MIPCWDLLDLGYWNYSMCFHPFLHDNLFLSQLYNYAPKGVVELPVGFVTIGLQ